MSIPQGPSSSAFVVAACRPRDNLEVPNFTGAPAAIGIPLDVTNSAADVSSRFGSRIAFTHSIDASQLAP